MAARLNLSKKQALALQARQMLPRRTFRGVASLPAATMKATVKATEKATGKASKPPATPPPMFGSALPVLLDAGDCLLRMRLAIRLTNGNTGRGGAWYQTAKFRDDCEAQLRAWGLTRQPFAGQVTVHLVRILGPRQRQWDSSSWQRGNWKEIEDALVAIGWFVDDGPQWIKATTYEEATNDRATGPAIVIEVRSAN